MVVACPLSLSAAEAPLPKPRAAVADLEVQSTRAAWKPQAAGSERLILTVAGPGDLYIREESEAGQPLYLPLFDAKGNRLPDGIYAYELRSVPRQNQETVVQSGYLSVRDGSFVDKDVVKPASETAPKSVGTKSLITQSVCMGSACVAGDDSVPVLKLKDSFVRLTFEDVVDGISYNRDWALQANDGIGGSERFFVWDLDAGTTPFSIEGNTADHALYVRSNSNIGLGTSTPAARLDVKASANGAAAQRLQSSSSTGYSGIEYLDNAGNVDLYFGIDNAASTTRLNSINNNPILLMTNSTERMRVTSGGSVGIGTSTPDAKLDVESSGSVEVRMTITGSNVWQLLNDFPGFGIQLVGTGFRAVNVDGGGNMQLHGTLTQGSSRDLKTDFASLDPQEVLSRVNALPVVAWRYKLDEPAVRHVGPTAEDFHKVFGLGMNDKTIAPSDQAGVALVAVQGLSQRVEEKTQEIEALRHKNADLEARIAALEALLSTSKPQE